MTSVDDNFYDNLWWQFLMTFLTIFDNFWKFDNFDNFWQFGHIFWKHLRFAENCQIFGKILDFPKKSDFGKISDFQKIFISLKSFQIFEKFLDFLKVFRFYESFQIFWKFSDFLKVFRFFVNFRLFESFCDLRLDTWDTDYFFDNWEQQYEQLHCDLWIQSNGDSIRNSCDV